MLFRNVLYARQLSHNCKPLLYQPLNIFGHTRLQLRNSFNNSRHRGRRPRLQPDPLEHLHIESGPLHPKGLVKPFLFTIGVSTVSLVGCVIWEYENLRAHATTLLKRPGHWLNAQQKKLLTQFVNPGQHIVVAQAKSEPGAWEKWWNSLKESEKVFYPILAANLLVFGAWRVRALQPLMVKYFCSNPSGSAVCLPMVLSTFSHYSLLHLAANMYVLYSFMPGALVMLASLEYVLPSEYVIDSNTAQHTWLFYTPKYSFCYAAVASLGKEQFVAMYLSAGVISSFTSFLYKVILNQPGLSLGASGAIMSVLSYVCVQYPDTRLSIIFLPMYTFAAGTAIKVIMGVDFAGVVFGWKFFDHAAHLGGALFGMAWCYWGSNYLWGNRDKFLQYYHILRKNDSGR